MRKPSVKKLQTVFGDNAKQARQILEMSREELMNSQMARDLSEGRYRRACRLEVRMEMLNAICDKSDRVESAALGNKQLITYLNARDIYDQTLYFRDGAYHVGSVGYLAERHGGMDLQEIFLD